MKSLKKKRQIIPIDKHKGIVSSSLLTNKFGRQTVLSKFITKMKVHDFRSRVIAGSIAGLATIVAIPTIFLISASALSNTIQSDWSGGVVDTPPGAPITINQSAPETTDKYSAIDNLDVTTPGKLLLGPTLNSASWCDITDVCDSTFKNRILVTVTNPGSQKTSANIELVVAYDSLMKSDFSDLRFITTDGNALLYYITSQTDGDNAHVVITIPTLPAGSSAFYMYYGKTGDVTTSARTSDILFKSIVSGYNNTCAIGQDGKAYCWGENFSGQLGNGDDIHQYVALPVQVSIPAGLIAKSLSLSDSYNGFICGIFGTAANNTNDKAYCWGNNFDGELGNDSTTSSSIPVEVHTPVGLIVKSLEKSNSYSCAILGEYNNTTSDKAYCWGRNDDGFLGDGTNTTRLKPVEVGTTGDLAALTVKLISVADRHACVIASDDQAYCWGINRTGELGNGSQTPSNKPVAVVTTGVLADKAIKSIYLSTVSDTSVSMDYTCAIAGNENDIANDKAYCWGGNSSGNLGNGSAKGTFSTTPVAVGTAPGLTILSMHSASGIVGAIASDGNPYFWGGGGNNSPVAFPITDGEIAGKTAKSIVASGWNVCVIAGNSLDSTSDRIYCLGENPDGQLGDGTYTSSYIPKEALIPTGLTVKDWSKQNRYSCAIAGNATDSTNDHAYCWGDNINGRLGDGTTVTRNIPVLVDLSPTPESLGTNSIIYNIAQYNNGATGLITSTVFYFNETGFYFGDGIVTINSNNDGLAKIKIRTSSNTDMSESTDWDSCILLSSGDKISDSNCVIPGQNYAQYQLYMSDDATLDIETTDIIFEYGSDSIKPSKVTSISIRPTENGSIVSNGMWTNTLGKLSYTGTAGNGWLGGTGPYSISYDDEDEDEENPLYYENGSYVGESINPRKPYISWSPATDTNGSGVAGYCLYFGQSSDTPEFQQSAGILSEYTSPVDTNGACQYAVREPSINLEDIVTSDLTDIDQLYFSVVAFDQAMNINDNPTTVSYLIDSEPPMPDTIFTGPSGMTNSKALTFSWTVAPDLDADLHDEGSGVAGLKYCAYSVFVGEDRCTDPENWSGPGNSEGMLSGGLYNLDDVFPGDSAHASFTTNPLDPNIGDNDVMIFLIAVLDKAGNATYVKDLQGQISNFLVITSQQAPTKPTNLAVSPESASDPETATSNSYSFNWDPPETYEGSVTNISYCYTINTLIEEGGANCNWTVKGQTELAEGPYATKQGKNTLYLMAKNEAGNFDIDEYETVDFYTDTTAPGIPSNVEIMDASTKPTTTGGTGSWKLALTWEEPTFGANTIASYRILRSTDGINYSSEDDPTGRTSSTNLSYIDSGLQQETVYYYKIVACDRASKCSVRSEAVSKAPTGHFTSPATLTVDSEVTDITTRKATITWYTDRATDSTAIAFGIKPGEDNYFLDGFGNQVKSTKHSVSLVNLQPGTKYYYIAKWTDEGGTGIEEEKSFTTLPAPLISEADVSQITVSGGTVNFTIENADKLNIYYGKTDSFGGAKAINTSSAKSSYSIVLSDLDDGTKYYYKLNGFDADGNEYSGNIYSFVTLARPRISNLRFQPVVGASSNTTKVTWTTNVPTNSGLSYGIVGESPKEMIDSKLTIEHEITISGLEDAKDYTLIASSRDASGNLAISDNQAFKTALDTRPPKISAVSVETAIKGSGAEARGQIIISWTTDEPATSQVAYGQGTVGSYSNKTSEDSRLSYEHTVVISDLSTSSIYQIQPISSDKARNESKGTNQSAIIGRGTEDVFTIIFNSLRNIFGIKG